MPLERWYYLAKVPGSGRGAARRRRNDAGRARRLSAALIQALSAQYQQHPGWTAQLHYDNLLALAQEDADLGEYQPMAPSGVISKTRGYHRKRLGQARHARYPPSGAPPKAQLEVRSCEAEYTHGLWHADFHHGSRRVLTANGRWVTPCWGIIDDHSRLVCHLQWYLDETAETLVRELCQALQKRGVAQSADDR